MVKLIGYDCPRDCWSYRKGRGGSWSTWLFRFWPVHQHYQGSFNKRMVRICGIVWEF